MSVNIINLDEKCLTAAMRNFVDLLCKPCSRNEEEVEGEDVCGLGKSCGPRQPLVGSTLGAGGPKVARTTTSESGEDGWGPSVHELEIMINELRDEVMNTFVKIELSIASDMNDFGDRVSELEEIDRESLRDVTSLSKKVRAIEEKHENLEDVVGGLSNDVLLNFSEMENLKVFVAENDVPETGSPPINPLLLP